MEALIEVLRNTPWWVFAIFFCLVLIGLNATRPRTVPVRRLFLLPIVFTAWNLLWLNERIQGHYPLLAFWFVGLAVGGFFGWLMVRNWTIHLENHHLVGLPGTWSTLILILLVFCVRYFFIYNYEAHPEAAPHLFLSDALISGVITGIFIGRTVGLIQKARKARQ